MASSTFLRPLIIEPTAAHELTIILLHGRGSDPEEFSANFGSPSGKGAQFVPSLFPNVRWIFPWAKCSYSSVFGMELREWFDIWSLTNVDVKWESQLQGLGDSIGHISELIEQETGEFEKQGKTKNRRIVLGGLSMGCATGVHVMLSLLAHGKGEELAGFLGWCGWMPLKRKVEKAGPEGLEGMYKDLGLVEREKGDGEDEDEEVAKKRLKHVPVFFSHCTGDSTVEIRHGKEMKDTLVHLGLDVKWTEYESDDHWIKEPEALDELVNFLERQLISLSNP